MGRQVNKTLARQGERQEDETIRGAEEDVARHFLTGTMYWDCLCCLKPAKSHTFLGGLDSAGMEGNCQRPGEALDGSSASFWVRTWS